MDSQRRTAASCTSSARNSAPRSPAKPSSAATATPRTHGAFGALAFGIGTTEVGHVLATQCLLQRKPKTMAINVTGTAAAGRRRQGHDPGASSAKSASTAAPATSSSTAASAIRALNMEERMTVCNMSIEAGARAGMIAPDDTTIEYLPADRRVPQGADWDAAVERWRQSAIRRRCGIRPGGQLDVSHN